MKRSAFALLALVLAAGPVVAMDHVPPGVDFFATRGDGQTFMDFASNPVPAGFFCPGSAPFTGRVEFRGVPIVGAPGKTDTIIERIDEASFNDKGVGSSRIRIRAVQLESLKPLVTSCGNFILRASLAEREQPTTRIRIRQTGEGGGFFNATLALNLRLSFHPVSGKGRVRVLEDTISFNRSSRFPWAVAADGAEVERSLTIDTNADGRPDTRVTQRGSFIAGAKPGHAIGEAGGSLIGAPQAVLTDMEQQLDPDEPEPHVLPDHGHYVEPICGETVFICP